MLSVLIMRLLRRRALRISDAMLPDLLGGIKKLPLDLGAIAKLLWQEFAPGPPRYETGEVVPLVSVRTLRRLVQAYKCEGISNLRRTVRACGGGRNTREPKTPKAQMKPAGYRGGPAGFGCRCLPEQHGDPKRKGLGC